MIQEVHCPHCRKTVAWDPDNRYRPFCSKRCRLIDLGEWFNEEHSIPGEDVDAMAPDTTDPSNAH